MRNLLMLRSHRANKAELCGVRLGKTCLLGGLGLLSACTGLSERLSQIGEKPPLTKIQNPTKLPDYTPVTMPVPTQAKAAKLPNSLWQPGEKSFFKDQRACKVGDILSVKVNLDEKADLRNNTTLDRSHTEKVSVPHLMGGASLIKKVLPAGANPANLVEMSSLPKHTAQARIDRREQITMNIAATVLQVLSNGNFVIFGRQEFRVDREVRELLIGGVIRPEDIGPDNTIPYERVAEARISYGGRGSMSNVQEPRYGTQLLDALLPF